jgi:FKBP-type peptidyl-prolyl cis-trans isomerase FklB
MKKLLPLVVILPLLAACQSQPAKVEKLSSFADSVSYSIGMDLGKNLKAQSIEVNPAAVAQGITDIMSADSATILTEEGARGTLMALRERMMAKEEETRKAAGDLNKAAGDAFFAANKSKEGVVTLPSGLQYRVITMGKGKKPGAAQTVSVHYTGKTLNGNVFDSSVERGAPAEFAVNQVIAGWTEALQLMPEGSRWELFIPSDLAYGAAGAGGSIGSNQALIFEIELLKVK